VTFLKFASLMRWKGKPLLNSIELYRQELFTKFFDEYDSDGRLRYNRHLRGVSKKNYKSWDAMWAATFACVGRNSPGGNQVLVLANDEGQAADDLALVKLFVAENPLLAAELEVQTKRLVRRDGKGFIEVLPAQDTKGAHGKTARLVVFDEVHAYKTYDLFEALALDPTRADAQQWITSYASLYHRPGIPLYDMFESCKRGDDPRTLFTWFAADYCTDPAMENRTSEDRANPSRGLWEDPNYLTQQQARLPAHRYRRLHLNLPGSPEGAAYQVEVVMEAIERGVRERAPQSGVSYVAACDMSGGSSDDACLAIAHTDADGRAIVDKVLNQGQRPPFDPRRAVERFVPVLREYGCTSVVLDAYAGETFKADFEGYGIKATATTMTASDAYEAFEVPLNGGRVVLPDVPTLEQQLLGLTWRNNKIDHPGGEHDDFACVVAHVVHAAIERTKGPKSFHLETVSVVRPTPGGEIIARLRRDPDQAIWRNFDRDRRADPRYN
jgi:phage terminase large subunit-like protein